MTEIFAFANVGPTQLILILVIILLLFGAKRLPELAKGLGKSLNEFKKATREVEDSFRDSMKDDEEDAPRKSKKSQTRRRDEEDYEDDEDDEQDSNKKES